MKRAVDEYVLELPCSALELQRRGVATDGEYLLGWVLELGKKIAVNVYCHGMGTDDPKGYLTLARTGPWDNYSLFNAGGTASGTDVITVFEKIRLVMPTRMGEAPRIICPDFTFSRSSGSVVVTGGNGTLRTNFEHAAYGVAQNSNGERTSHAGMDLRGTPFAVMCDFRAFGWSSTALATITHHRQVVKLEGGGYQGGCGPPDAINAHNRVLNGRVEAYWEKCPQTIPLKLKDKSDSDSTVETSFKWNAWNDWLTEDEENVLRSYGPY